ncbi:MAG: Uma2 family endonuclease [Ktedonobacterales bacterium]
MKHDVFAPWAEPAPNAPFPMRAEDLLTLPDDGWQYEIVEGRLVRMPGSGNARSRIAMYLGIMLGTFAKPRKLGSVSGADGAYDLTLQGETQETALSPAVTSVRAGRLPALNTAEASKTPHAAPDLVAEVASPSQHRPEMAAQAQMYLDRGVALVWIIGPARQEVDVWRSGVPTVNAWQD